MTTFSLYILVDPAYPLVPRYAGQSRRMELRTPRHRSSNTKELRSSVDVWRSAVLLLGREIEVRLVASLSDDGLFFHSTKPPLNVRDSEAALMFDLQSRFGRMLNVQTVTASRKVAGVSVATYRLYLGECRHAVLGRDRKGLLAVRRWESRYPQAMYIFGPLIKELLNHDSFSKPRCRRTRQAASEETLS